VPDVTHDHESLLRRLALGDEHAVASMMSLAVDAVPCGLDAKHRALARLAGVIAVAATTPEYQWCVDLALAAGASDDEVVGVLVSVAPVVGTARVVAAAPELAVALGYDIDTALEAPEPPREDA
jgi:4-carboxymuconolactone decarboxylase